MIFDLVLIINIFIKEDYRCKEYADESLGRALNK